MMRIASMQRSDKHQRWQMQANIIIRRRSGATLAQKTLSVDMAAADGKWAAAKMKNSEEYVACW